MCSSDLNGGSLGGSTTVIGGLKFEAHRFVTRKVSVGLGYSLNLDYSLGTVPVRGWELMIRRYFSGSGTRVSSSSPLTHSITQDRSAFFFGPTLGLREYFVGSAGTGSDPIDPASGSFMTLGVALGADWSLSRDWLLTLQASSSLLTFAATDERVRLTSTLLDIGFSYLW